MATEQQTFIPTPVEGKVDAALICEHRPLLPGEIPKRKGDKTVYEATGAVNPEFLQNLDSYVATAKLDGTCCKILNGRLYRRRDLHKGQSAPEGSTPGLILTEEGLPEVAWIDVTESMDPEDQLHLSALGGPSADECVNPVYGEDNQGCFASLDDEGDRWFMDLTSENDGTYELIGPKVQGNPYSLPEDRFVDVKLTKKTVKVPRHYLVKHGTIPLPDFDLSMFRSENPVEKIREYVISHRLEGIVFHSTKPGLPIFKVNRGHLNQPIKKGEKLSYLGLLSKK